MFDFIYKWNNSGTKNLCISCCIIALKFVFLLFLHLQRLLCRQWSLSPQKRFISALIVAIRATSPKLHFFQIFELCVMYLHSLSPSFLSGIANKLQVSRYKLFSVHCVYLGMDFKFNTTFQINMHGMYLFMYFPFSDDLHLQLRLFGFWPSYF